MRTFAVIAAVSGMLMLASCLNSSTAFVWRSVSYQTTPEAGEYVTVEEQQGAASVNAEKTTSDAFKAEIPGEELENGGK